jgi:hypothetical protein
MINDIAGEDSKSGVWDNLSYGLVHAVFQRDGRVAGMLAKGPSWRVCLSRLIIFCEGPTKVSPYDI